MAGGAWTFWGCREQTLKVVIRKAGTRGRRAQMNIHYRASHFENYRSEQPRSLDKGLECKINYKTLWNRVNLLCLSYWPETYLPFCVWPGCEIKCNTGTFINILGPCQRFAISAKSVLSSLNLISPPNYLMSPVFESSNVVYSKLSIAQGRDICSCMVGNSLQWRNRYFSECMSVNDEGAGAWWYFCHDICQWQGLGRRSSCLV